MAAAEEINPSLPHIPGSYHAINSRLFVPPQKSGQIDLELTGTEDVYPVAVYFTMGEQKFIFSFACILWVQKKGLGFFVKQFFRAFFNQMSDGKIRKRYKCLQYKQYEGSKFDKCKDRAPPKYDEIGLWVASNQILNFQI